MADRRDPIEVREDGSMDLYEISDWEVRSRLDRFAVRLNGLVLAGVRWFVIATAVLILVAQFALGGLGLVADPMVGAFVLLSVVPAAILAAYLWHADVTTQEPLELLVGTFLLGLLFASFAGILNSQMGGVVAAFTSGFGTVPVLGFLGLFFLVVGPVEEAVKLLAVRLHAYRSPSFNAVIDGAVYGAVAGLGFATIENALYITQSLDSITQTVNAFEAGSNITTIRALTGPGHVIYSAFAGYYLGLAKFNREYAGPLVVKGLVIAALIHGVYNTSAAVLVPAAADALAIPAVTAFVGFVVVYDGLFIYLLIRKLSRYNRAYHAFYDEPNQDTPLEADRSEFE
jgi:RsiW-degrading membrane proteinase PrsW (M82 family)